MAYRVQGGQLRTAASARNEVAAQNARSAPARANAREEVVRALQQLKDVHQSQWRQKFIYPMSFKEVDDIERIIALLSRLESSLSQPPK